MRTSLIARSAAMLAGFALALTAPVEQQDAVAMLREQPRRLL